MVTFAHKDDRTEYKDSHVVGDIFLLQKRLLEAMANKEHLLTKEEKSRNRHGPHLMSQYTTENMGPYPSSLPGVFPDLPFSRAQ